MNQRIKSLFLAAVLIVGVSFCSAATARPSRGTKKNRIHKGELTTLLIGINYQGSQYELENCVHDIEHVQKYLLKPYLHARSQNTILMTDFRRGTKYYPTAANIRARFKEFVNKLNKTKHGYFHYSGHGSYIRDTSGDERDRRDEVIVPIDCDRNGFISDDEIFRTLVRGLKRDVKLTVTSDSCFSGTVLDLPYKWNSKGRFTRESRYTKRQLASFSDVVLISASSDKQTASDGGVISGDPKGAGAMTAAFIETLRAYNYRLTYRQLLKGVKAWLVREGFSQTPQLSSTRRLNLNDYYIAVKPSKVTLRP